MPRALSFCFTIVAAFQLHLAAASPTFEEAPVASPVLALADRLGLDPTRDRARFMTEMARLLYASTDVRPPISATERPVVTPPRARVTVPVPLGSAIWGRAVFRRVVPPDQLVVMIIADQRATLLCRGLAALDDETLTYLAEHPAMLTMLYERGAPVFAAFGGNLRIRGGRVVPPGGEQAVELWEAIAHEPVTEPERFARVLFTEHDGRLAYLFDVVASADRAAAAFVLGYWIPDRTERLKRFEALFAATTNGYREWRVLDHPFARPLADLSVLLMRMRLAPSGAPQAPASRAFWARAFDVDASTAGADDRAPDLVDAAWLVGATSDLDMYSRNERIDQFAFGQRAFADLDDTSTAPVAEVVRRFRDYRMLLLTIERMGIRTPEVYASALRRAEAVADGPFDRRFWSLAQFQGGLALLARMRHVGTVSGPAAEELVTTFLAIPIRDGEFGAAMGLWIRNSLARHLPEGALWETRVIAALAGPSTGRRAPRISWEGQMYRLDLPLAERQRLEIVRRKQGGHTLDLALGIDAAGRELRASGLALDDVRSAAINLKKIADESAARLKTPVVNLVAPGVAPVRDAYEWVLGASQELGKITKPGDVRRAARVGESLQELAAIAFGHTLLSFAYAADLGDPDSAALLAGNVALRHDFGLARKDSAIRGKLPWAIPRQDFQPGVAWHIAGSIMGLDFALASLHLRRLATDRIPEAPKLSSLEREALAVNVSLMNPRRLTDADRNAIGDAIARGRARVQRLPAGGESLDTIAEELGFDGWRRREMQWALAEEPAVVPSRFTLVELLALGGGAGTADLDAWGTPAIYSEGCPCMKLPSARAWRMMEGRPQLPLMTATMGDLNLAVALILRDLNLPAALTQPVLTVGMQDFIDELSPLTSYDWWTLSRQAQSLRRRNVEDYVSAAAAVNGPLVPDDSEASFEP